MIGIGTNFGVLKDVIIERRGLRISLTKYISLHQQRIIFPVIHGIQDDMIESLCYFALIGYSWESKK